MAGRESGRVYIGCAGWSIPSAHRVSFPSDGSHLERYARVFPAVEINSSFYREHKPATYQRWARSVPAEFRFSVKVPKAITHVAKLGRARAPLRRFLEGPRSLGRKLGPLLVQLPPSLKFDARHVDTFFRTLRVVHPGPVVCEPRHATWFEEAAERVLRRHRVARVAADPAPVPAAARPGGWSKIVYYRLHGSPRVYYSSYSGEFLGALAGEIRARASGARVWCIFDNTAAGAAAGDALLLMEKLGLRTG